MLEVRDLHKYYGSFHAVRGISFDVARGEILGFLGPNGAGKTTTMKIVVGFMTMSAGEVRVDGLDVVRQSMEVRRAIGYLPEHAPLYEDMTVTEYLNFIADVRGLRGGQRKERMDYVIGVCALEAKKKSGIKTLSKGYRQRVGLAQAIIHDPRLVILDEPTVGLDPNQIIEIRNLIQEIGQRNTVVLSSHILGEVEATCSRVVIINEGLIVANGSPDQLEADLEGEGHYEILLSADLEEARTAVAELVGMKALVDGHRMEAGCRLRVAMEDLENPVATITDWAGQRGWILVEVRRPRQSLEDVFRTLTLGPSATGEAKHQTEAEGAGA